MGVKTKLEELRGQKLEELRGQKLEKLRGQKVAQVISHEFDLPLQSSSQCYIYANITRW